MHQKADKFFIIGHRGAAGEHFENSLAGIKHAITLGIDAIEIDVREHASEFWVIHDNDMERLTGVNGLFEDQADISRLRLRNGEPVPSLQQVLNLTSGKVALNIEIKAVKNLDRLLALLEHYPIIESIDGLPSLLLSSFNHLALLRLRQLDCNLPLAPISSGIPLQIAVEVDRLKPFSWHFDDEYLDWNLVQELLRRGIPSLVYTVNTIDRARQLKQLAVAGIFTDYPSKMIEVV